MSVPAAGVDQRRAVFGAVDYASGQVVWQLAAHKGGEAFAAFLARLARAWPDEQVVLVMDNVSYHRAPAVRAWWAEQGGREKIVIMIAFGRGIRRWPPPSAARSPAPRSSG